MVRYLLAAAALLLLAAACAELRRNVPVTPGNVPTEVESARWPDLPVRYCVVEQPGMGFEDRETLLRLSASAFAAWGVPAERQDECNNAIDMGDEVNEIGWGHLPPSAAPAHKAGETSIRYEQLLGGGEADIMEADIVLEPDPAPGLDSAECLYSTLLHEVGHFLGAHHAAPPAVMAAALSSCPQELTQADLNMVRALYPPAD